MNLDVVVSAPYLEPLQAFGQQYGMMVIGAFLVLIAFNGRKFSALALFPLVIGLGIFVAGCARNFVPWLG